MAASAQSWPISSWFWWGGEVVERVEHLVFFKTVDDRFDGICAAVRRVHSYVLPAVVMVELSGLGPGYFEWLAESTRGGVG